MVGTVPPKKSKEEVIGRNGLTTKMVKKLLVGTPPPKCEEVICRNSPTKNSEEVIGRNNPTKK